MDTRENVKPRTGLERRASARIAVRRLTPLSTEVVSIAEEERRLTRGRTIPEPPPTLRDMELATELAEMMKEES